MSFISGSKIERWRLLIQGIVQGVGFRPFVYGLALRYDLVGFVLNDSQGVTIEIEGSLKTLDKFHRALREELPLMARIDSVVVELIPTSGDESFVIKHSQKGNERLALISSDSATCEDCLRELLDPTDRRYGYPFINCTNCGPRFTIVQDIPYDREKTTMRSFPMCSDCQAEYVDPLNRRFHAQPNACRVCGPQVSLIDWHKSDIKNIPTSVEVDPIVTAAQRLTAGAILAIKGLGGYHLACDALNIEAVQKLRQRKHREAKPFALMVPNLETARLLCKMNDAEAAFLQSRRRPIVLLEQQDDCPIAPGVAPSYKSLGIMLPYTPIHHLLLRAFTSEIDASRPPVLVITSGNLSDQPIVYRSEDVQERLGHIADGLLTHNRDIHMRCDDSVIRVGAYGALFFRRSRGYAPEPLSLFSDLPLPLLACGGHLKNTFCLGKGRLAFVSHYIGDLENHETLTSFREAIEHYQRLFDIYPQCIAHDLHPEYLATKYALDTDIPRKIAIQHHHAHIASVLAEHQLNEPVIGVAADGTGFGTDGKIWGCEVMMADLAGFERLAHLAYVPLLGGEMAVRQPWRLAVAYLAQAYGDAFLELEIPFVQQLDRTKWRILSLMMAKSINSPATSSLGRLFDAVAALVNLRKEVLYEGQAAIELEIMAVEARMGSSVLQTRPYPFALQKKGTSGEERFIAPTWLDVAPMIRAIVHDIQQGLPVSYIANRFHRTIAELLVVACAEARARTGLTRVALSGGVFQNRLLLETLMERLKDLKFQVYINHLVPPNDGGLSFGQLAVASAQLQKM